jgi:ferredoxin-NADP reductase
MGFPAPGTPSFTSGTTRLQKMAVKKTGTVCYWRKSSPILAVFRLLPEEGSRFPSYKAGQYIALQRNDCRLTKKVINEGRVEYVTILDADGKPKRGAVTHSYSIASAPYETEQHGYLEFYVILEIDEKGVPGRLTESMFRMSPDGDNKLVYYDKIAGDFTLDKRAVGCRNVFFVGTGTGLAPFVSMVKQLDFEARSGKASEVRYTLLHTNRTFEELDYYQDLLAIEEAGRFDFVYVPTVSRPTERDRENPRLGAGRANNVLRHILGLPLKEEEDLRAAEASGGDVARARAALEKTVRPVLPRHLSAARLAERMDPPSSTVVITCGNPWSMEDIKHAAESCGMRFEKEDW